MNRQFVLAGLHNNATGDFAGVNGGIGVLKQSF